MPAAEAIPRSSRTPAGCAFLYPHVLPSRRPYRVFGDARLDPRRVVLGHQRFGPDAARMSRGQSRDLHDSSRPSWWDGCMAPSAISGINHVAVVTADLDRLAAFYGELFDASLVARFDDEQGRHGLFDLGAGSFLHAFEQRHNAHAAGHHDMFDRGHIDHFAVAARDEVSFEALRAELMRRGCSDGAVTDFGVGRSVYFEDPDGMGCEVMLLTVDLQTAVALLDTAQTPLTTASA
jgi:catechol 2,3-dioxygenase-like lactoylglutathione lyase family enzyme